MIQVSISRKFRSYKNNKTGTEDPRKNLIKEEYKKDLITKDPIDRTD